MYSIAYVVPYFGKFPKGFQFWLMSCGCNPTIDWLIFTDDHMDYNYPPNVKVQYWTFEQMKRRVQKIFNFPISLERPYKLCDYKPAYGEIFSDELKGYDFWGDCDVDSSGALRSLRHLRPRQHRLPGDHRQPRRGGGPL